MNESRENPQTVTNCTSFNQISMYDELELVSEIVPNPTAVEAQIDPIQEVPLIDEPIERPLIEDSQITMMHYHVPSEVFLEEIYELASNNNQAEVIEKLNTFSPPKSKDSQE